MSEEPTDDVRDVLESVETGDSLYIKDEYGVRRNRTIKHRDDVTMQFGDPTNETVAGIIRLRDATFHPMTQVIDGELGSGNDIVDAEVVG